MTVNFYNKKLYLAVFFFIFFGFLFRFYNLSWGAPFFFHPDERNIAISISQLSYPSQLNPHFFAYGSFPIYCIYFTGVLTNFVQNVFLKTHSQIFSVGFENAIIIGRFYSSIFSLLVLYLIFNTGKLLGGVKAGLISFFFALFSVGFIQYAHFATFETWLSLFTLFLCYLIVLYVKHGQKKYLVYSSVVMGLLMSIKISSLVFAPLSILLIVVSDLYRIRKHKNIYNFEKIILSIFIFISAAVFTIVVTSPYFWFDNADFLSSIHYESSVALGSLPVFYSQIFQSTTPVIYQLIKVYPFILSPLIALLFIVLFFKELKDIIIRKDVGIIILIAFFLLAFFSQAILFVKWIRYYIPTLSFVYILLSITIVKALEKANSRKKKLYETIIFVIFISSFIYSFSYFKTVLFSPDTRVSASLWAKKNINRDATILSEVYDLGIVPFNPYFSTIKLFNFYDLEVLSEKQTELKKHIEDSQYIIVPSQRILESRMLKPSIYPKGNSFYKALLNGTGGFKKIYETPCDIFCQILYLGNPIYSFEQTANVFDRPTLLIFKKNRN